MNKVVLITGASAGMGKATALCLAQNGFTVYGAARRIERMNDLKKAGVKIIYMDVASDESIRQTVHDILQKEQKIDILINNAGYGLLGALEDVPMADARHQMEVNVVGLARLIQLVLPHMRQQQSGKIINISSTGGKISSPLGAWYHGSKFALEAISDSLRLEVKQFGIDVIIIEPGGIQSEWGDIATTHMRDLSSGGPYHTMAQKLLGFAAKVKAKNEDPAVIAKLIFKAINAKKPKARYHAGYLAGTILFLRKLLSDKHFDNLILCQLK